jgi:hypothetical protein
MFLGFKKVLVDHHLKSLDPTLAVALIASRTIDHLLAL